MSPMIAALTATGTGLLLWPRVSVDAARIRRLSVDHRLVAPVSPRTQWQSLRGSIAGPTLTRMTGLAALAVVGVAVGVAIAVVPAEGALAGAEFGTCTVLVGATGLVIVRRMVDARSRANRAARISVGLALLVGEIDAGATPEAALGAVGSDIEARVRAGPSGAVTGESSGRSALRHGDDLLDRVAFAWQLSGITGVPLAESLGRVRADLSDKAATQRELSALVAGPQASATILALLPLLGTALGSAIGADPIGVLFGTAIGRLLLCVGVALDAAGLFWTMNLIDRALR